MRTSPLSTPNTAPSFMSCHTQAFKTTMTIVDVHARPLRTSYGCPAPPPHCSFDTTGILQSRWGWLSRPPFAVAPRGACPFTRGRFCVLPFFRDTRQATPPIMAKVISAGRPNIGHLLSPLSSRRARRTPHATIATSTRDAWTRLKNTERRGGDGLY